jgi:GTP 3',8-cyclase
LPLRRSLASDVAERWQLADGSLEIGVISSVSQPFCGDCSRVRLSADGQLYTCLFASQGHDLRSVLREQGTATLIETVSRIWGNRADRYSELRASATAGMPSGARAEMYHLGG